MPELSSCVSPSRLNNRLHTPSLNNRRSWPLSRSLPPSSVHIPRRSRMVTSPDSRIEISIPIPAFTLQILSCLSSWQTFAMSSDGFPAIHVHCPLIHLPAEHQSPGQLCCRFP